MSNGNKVPVVPAKSWSEIGRVAEKLIRSSYPNLLVTAASFPIDDFFEFKMKNTLGFDYEVSDLPPGIEAAMDPNNKLVILSPQTYDDLINGVARARFTVAHEIGHVVLHSKFLRNRIMDGAHVLRLNRGIIKPYRDPECQANAFAAPLLMPTRHVSQMVRQGSEVRTLVETFNVSWEAAEYRINNLNKYLK